MKSIITLLCAILVLSCYRTSEKKSIKKEEKMEYKNKQIVQDFYKNVFGKADSIYASGVLTDGYIQHNPMVKTGRAGFLETISFLKQIPKPENPTKPFMRIIAEGKYVVVHFQVEFAGQKKTVLDLYRLDNGLIAEHWDAIQESSASTVNGNPEVAGTVAIEKENFTIHNKRIVRNYTNLVLVARNFNLMPDYLASNLIQHNPQIDNGLESLKKYYDKTVIEKVHRIIGEGNFVVTQSSGQKEGKKSVFYDVYRLEQGQIFEHWSVSQLIPEKMAHENGMI